MVATSNLYFALSDMDAQTANVLLVGDRANLGITRDEALRIYEQRRQEVAGYLQSSGATAGDDQATGNELRAVLVALGRYEALAAQAILVEKQSPARPGRPTAAALELYRQATDVMHQQLLPAARRLTDGSAALVEHRYAAAQSSISGSTVAVTAIGVLLLAFLGGLQLFLLRRYRRLLNPLMALATLAALALLTASLVVLVRSEETLRAVKKDAFDSVLALGQARAISYDANADESRYLLDPARAGQYESAFAVKSRQLADVGDVGVDGYDPALRRGLSDYHDDGGEVTFGGYYGTALRNITFPGERAVADLTVQRYQAYQLADRRIRRLNTSGELDEAIRFAPAPPPTTPTASTTATTRH